MMRIAAVHPSSVESLPEEETRRRALRRKSYASPGTELVDYHVVGNSIFNQPFSAGFAGDVIERSAQQIRAAAASAPDAIMVLGGIEPGVRICREEIRQVPIVGTGQSTFHVALQIGAQVGYRLGLLVYEDSLIAPIREQACYYKADWMVSEIRSIDIPLPELYARRPEVRERMIKVARQLVAAGATMIFPQGLSMMPSTMSAEELSREIGGVPVLNGEQITIRTAEMLAGLKLWKSNEAGQT